MIEIQEREGRQRLRVIFTDRDGNDWRLVDAQVISGNAYARMVGEHGATMRGFVNVATGERRRYLFRDEHESRWPVPKFLEAQLAAAEWIRPRPQRVEGAESAAKK